MLIPNQQSQSCFPEASFILDHYFGNRIYVLASFFGTLECFSTKNLRHIIKLLLLTCLITRRSSFLYVRNC